METANRENMHEARTLEVAPERLGNAAPVAREQPEQKPRFRGFEVFVEAPLYPFAEGKKAALGNPLAFPGIPVREFPVGSKSLAPEPLPRVERPGYGRVGYRVPLCLVADAVSRFREYLQFPLLGYPHAIGGALLTCNNIAATRDAVLAHGDDKRGPIPSG